MSKTPFERKGWKPNDVFVVTKDCTAGYRTEYLPREGDIAMLYWDFGHFCIAQFYVGDRHVKHGRNLAFIEFEHLRKIGTL